LVLQELMSDASYSRGGSGEIRMGGHLCDVRPNANFVIENIVAEGLQDLSGAQCYFHVESDEDPRLLRGVPHSPDIHLYEMLACLVNLIFFSSNINFDALYLVVALDNIGALFNFLKSGSSFKARNYLCVLVILSLFGRYIGNTLPFFYYIRSKFNSTDVLTRVDREETLRAIYTNEKVRRLDAEWVDHINEIIRSETDRISSRISFFIDKLEDFKAARRADASRCKRQRVV